MGAKFYNEMYLNKFKGDIWAFLQIVYEANLDIIYFVMSE